ncbi:MAG: hypothetical protein EBU26_18070, partial [Verrucomicrobia bacterium]|nr:hypothetical protein [Verrucomicrobiota bacterium]
IGNQVVLDEPLTRSAPTNLFVGLRDGQGLAKPFHTFLAEPGQVGDTFIELTEVSDNGVGIEVGDTLYLGGVSNRMIVDGELVTRYGDILIDILGDGILYESPMMSHVPAESAKKLNNFQQGIQGLIRTEQPGGLIEIKTSGSVVMAGQTFVNGSDAQVVIRPETFFELVQIAGVISAQGRNALVDIHAPDAVYINGEIRAGMDWEGGVRVPVGGAEGADVRVISDHELRIFGSISSRDELILQGYEDQDYNENDEVDASIQLTGQLYTDADRRILTLQGPQDILIEGSIFVRGEQSGLRIESDQRVKFDTSFVEVSDGIEVLARGRNDDVELKEPRDEGQALNSSILIGARAVIQSFAAGSDVQFMGAHDVDVMGTIVAGGSIGPQGVTWSGPDSSVRIVAGGQAYIDNGVLASGQVHVVGLGADSLDGS